MLELTSLTVLAKFYLHRILREYLCKLGFVIAGLTRNPLKLEKIAGQARSDKVAYLFTFLLNETAPFFMTIIEKAESK